MLYGRGDEEVGVPYQPFAEALEWYTGHVGQPVLGRHPGELSRLQPLLGSRLVGLAAPVSSDPRSEEYLLFEATRSWLVELSRRRPVVLMLGTYRDTELGRGHALAGVMGAMCGACPALSSSRWRGCRRPRWPS